MDPGSEEEASDHSISLSYPGATARLYESLGCRQQASPSYLARAEFRERILENDSRRRLHLRIIVGAADETATAPIDTGVEKA